MKQVFTFSKLNRPKSIIAIHQPNSNPKSSVFFHEYHLRESELRNLITGRNLRPSNKLSEALELSCNRITLSGRIQFALPHTCPKSN
ncbi:hypothetical protein CEXT_663121 [Caerostris extrusa]|uniref:Uncharacterized protein n=1 Tax=Caerostris extrusa TaxID=172846 RepID=A0AAV4YAZ2_CAEEX|nr:hypothetical protein CEXT_663121 [Caerostris extrusa]